MQSYSIPRWLSLPLIVVVALVGLTACDAAQGDPEPVDAGELSQTFSGTDSLGGEITVNYPADWAQSGDANSLILANRQELLDNNLQGSPQPEDAIALISLLPGIWLLRWQVTRPM